MTRKICLAFLMVVAMVFGAKAINIKDVVTGAYQAQGMAQVTPLADGETWAQISDDGQRIESYSFRTGKKVATIFDAATVRGPKVRRVDG